MGNLAWRPGAQTVSPASPAVPPSAEAGSVIMVDLRHIGAEPAAQDQPHVRLLTPQTQEQIDKEKKQEKEEKKELEKERKRQYKEDHPRDWLMLAVLSCLLNPFCGLYACKMARESQKERRKGNLETAHSYGKSALQFSMQGIAVSITISITIFILVVGLN